MRIMIACAPALMLASWAGVAAGQAGPGQAAAANPARQATAAPAAPAGARAADLVVAPPRLTDRPEDEKAILSTAEAFVNAYNAGDAQRLASLFTSDAEVIDEHGDRIVGRDRLLDEYSALLGPTPRSTMKVAVQSLRFLGPDAAREEGQTRLFPPDGGHPSVRRYTVLYVRQGGAWRYASVREEHDGTLPPHEHLLALAWMIGDWIDEDPSAVVHTHCDWSPDGNFLLRDFTVHVRGRAAMAVHERIGWDPQARQVRSWVFDSEGGYGGGLWSGRGGRWVVKSSGVVPDGQTASATHIITRLGDQRYRWAAVDRVVGGRVVPEREEYVLVRTPPRPSGAGVQGR